MNEKDKEFDQEFLQPIRDEHIQAIETGDVDKLARLAEKIDVKLNYERKYRDDEDEKKRWEELNSMHQQFLLWIESL